MDRSHPLFAGLGESPFVYFVHSYYVPIGDYTAATSAYNVRFSAAVQKDNFYGIQFHAEKSGAVGSAILENFIKI